MFRKIYICLLFFLLLSNNVWAVNIKTGSYVGDGADPHAITGIGFEPDFVMIRKVGTQETVFSTSSMSMPMACLITAMATCVSSIRIESLDSDGFTVGSSSYVNTASSTYSYIAIESDSVNFAVGSYTGNATDNISITGVGFQPTVVIIKKGGTSTSYAESVWSSSSFSADSSKFLGYGYVAAANHIQSFISDGFTIGSSNYVNASGITYYWVAFKDLESAIKSGVFVGDGTDSRSITGFGFQPDFVMVQGNTTVITSGSYGTAHWPGTDLASDESYRFYLEGSRTNDIQAREADGFQVGTTYDSSNNGGISYYYLGLTDYSSIPDEPPATPKVGSTTTSRRIMVF